MASVGARTIVLGSRPSRLALWQTGAVLDQLKAAWPELDFRVVTLDTEGDKILDRPLPEIGGKGVFTADLEAALRAGEIDLAVHSLKDLPIEESEGLIIGAIGQRADARDVLVSASGKRLMDLPQGARVGTSSLRRQAQLLAARPDLAIQSLRGNVDTRVRKAQRGDYDAIVLAAAGMERLSLAQAVSERLPFDLMLPAPGQGALAVQCRAGDTDLLTWLVAIHDPATQRAVTAERSFLAELDAGCSAPVAAYAQIKDEALRLDGLVGSPDGACIVRVQARQGLALDPADLGRRLAGQALAAGAGELLR
jgi:hydroxymethylbilane synthase